MGLQEQIALARARAEAARARVSTDDFIAEEKARKEMARHLDEEAAALAREREMVIERLRGEWMGKGAEVVAIDALPHVFVVQGAGAAAYRAMRQGIQDAATGAVAKGTRAKIKLDDVNHEYTLKGIRAWNADGRDMAIEDEESTDGAALDKFLRDTPGAVSQLMTAIQRLDGDAAEARKS